MYRHYSGNSGKSRRVEEPKREEGRFNGKVLAPMPERPARSAEKPREEPAKASYNSPPSPLSGLSGELGKLFGKLGSFSFETEDLLLIAVLYLMYRESGDKELLIMMGALLFL